MRGYRERSSADARTGTLGAAPRHATPGQQPEVRQGTWLNLPPALLSRAQTLQSCLGLRGLALLAQAPGTFREEIPQQQAEKWK